MKDTLRADMSSQIFKKEELEALLSSAILGGANDEECQKLVEWATNTRVANSILQEILTGKHIVLVREDGEPCYKGSRQEEKRSRRIGG